MKKIKRGTGYQLTLEIKDDDFVSPPRATQRNWLLNRFLKEASDDLAALHELSRGFVGGSDTALAGDRTQGDLADADIMEDWQISVMKEMAAEICRPESEVLEIGFGRGIASDFIQSHGVKRHAIVECNQAVIRRFQQWKSEQSDPESISLIEGKWQDTVEQFELYDGIFFHTYPLNEAEYSEYVAKSSTFAEHFFDTAAAHLHEGGCFTYLTNEIDSLSRSHQRALLDRFRSFSVRKLCDLGVPEETRDAQWAQTTVVVRAVK